eukprot:1292460-Prymnesium_polylepis.1
MKITHWDFNTIFGNSHARRPPQLRCTRNDTKSLNENVHSTKALSTETSDALSSLVRFSTHVRAEHQTDECTVSRVHPPPPRWPLWWYPRRQLGSLSAHTSSAPAAHCAGCCVHPPGGHDGGGSSGGAGDDSGAGGNRGGAAGQHSSHPASGYAASDVHVIVPPATRTPCGPLVPQKRAPSIVRKSYCYW